MLISRVAVLYLVKPMRGSPSTKTPCELSQINFSQLAYLAFCLGNKEKIKSRNDMSQGSDDMELR